MNTSVVLIGRWSNEVDKMKKERTKVLVIVVALLGVLVFAYFSPLGSVLGLKAPTFCSNDHWNPECYCEVGEIALTVQEFLGEDYNEGMQMWRENYRICKPYVGYISSHNNDPETYGMITSTYAIQQFEHYCPNEAKESIQCSPSPPYWLNGFAGIMSSNGKELLNVECVMGYEPENCIPPTYWYGEEGSVNWYVFSDEERARLMSSNIPKCSKSYVMGRMVFYVEDGTVPPVFDGLNNVGGCYFGGTELNDIESIRAARQECFDSGECYFSDVWLEEVGAQ